MANRGMIGAVKGFRDVLPDESRHWRSLEDKAATLFARYGFGEIRLPVLERTELFARSLGETTDIVEKEMYSFVDRDDPLADAELLVMLTRYLGEVEARDTRLELNSVGDARCRPVYRERLREFGMAHLAALCPDCHRRLERNPLRILDCKVEGCRAVVARAPVMLDSLCDPCRAHLDELRKLLAEERVPYVMNPRLV